MANPNWTRGVSGNPKGRPKRGETFSDIIAAQGRRRDVETTGPDGKKKLLARKEALARKLWSLALGGDMAAIRYVYDRVDGTPKQQIEHSGAIDPVQEMTPEERQQMIAALIAKRNANRD